MRKIVLALTALSTISINAQIEYPGSVTVGSSQIVFDYSTDACATEDIPDVPARAFRDASGKINLIASHYVNRRMTGNDFNSLNPDCNIIMSSHEDSDPSKFNTKEWISSVYTEDGVNIHALIHDEYVPCGNWNTCWYNAITYASSSDSGKTYTHATAPNHLVAASPYQSPYPNTHSPFGIFGGSNIIKKDGYYYKFVQLETYQLQDWGTGVMRTANLGDPSSWRGWDGNGWNVQFVNPYTANGYDPADKVLAPISRDNIGKMCASVTYNTYFGKYILVDFTVGEVGGTLKYGFYYSLSADLIHWSKKQFIMQTQQTWGVGGSNYPSLIDHNDNSRNFENTGQTCYLYYTKWNSGTYDRDLVRVALTFSKNVVSYFEVNSTGNQDDATPGDGVCKTTSNLCSMRAAIQEANARPMYDGYDTVALPIRFKITSGASPIKIIKPASYLPEIFYPLYIDGYTQTSASANTNNFDQGLNTSIKIVLDAEDGAAHALAFHCGNNTIKGLSVINGNIDFLYEEGYSKSTDNNTIEGNYIGIGADGTTAYWGAINFNNQSNNLVGGSTNASRNLIAGGVIMTKSDSNQIINNYFATDYTGTAPSGTSANSIEINDSSSYNVVGGANSNQRNLISAGNRGVVISGAHAANNQILGNYIGVAPNGIAALGNSSSGITLMSNTHHNIIGTTAAPNVICANSAGEAGIWIDEANDNIIQANFIGTDASQTYALGNGQSGNFCAGIVLKGSSTTGNTIGGWNAAEGNIIANNHSHGIAVFGDVSTGNAFLSNIYYNNEEMAIDLSADDAVNGNDNQDGDNGPNDGQNFPDLSLAETDGSTIEILGNLNSLPNGTYKIQFYYNAACDGIGNGEGEVLIGTSTVSTNGSGDAAFDETFNVAVSVGSVVTAIATDANNNSSEFSACVQVDQATSVSTTTTSTFKVYPTKANEQIFIESNEVFTYTLLDMNGKIVLASYSTSPKTIVDISTLEQGVYLIQIQNATALEQKTIIK